MASKMLLTIIITAIDRGRRIMKKKVLIFDYDNMKRAGQLLNSIQTSGVNSVRALAEVSYILDSGEVSEIEVLEEKEAR